MINYILAQTNVVYEFKFPISHDQVASCIGISQNTCLEKWVNLAVFGIIKIEK